VTYAQLAEGMRKPGITTLTLPIWRQFGEKWALGTVTGILSGFEREDGSGRSFNVTLNTPTGYQTVHVRTTD
jgi:hypothetical protein